jgi:hypothetical protein
MSTLVQIESAVADLPAQEQWFLLSWLQTRLTTAPKAATQPHQRPQTEVDQWLAELAALRAKTSTGKVNVPLHQLMDEIREERC